MRRWFEKVCCAAALASAGQAMAAEVPAVLQWTQRVELSTPVSGTVRTVNVAAGERVRKGQLLLQLDDRVLASRADEAAAAVARQREEAAEAARELKRVEELYERSVIATTELDQARLRQAAASARLGEAQARYRRETRQRDDSSLRAPFDAVVVVRLAEPGQAVAAGLQPPSLLVLARAGEMSARAQVTEAQIAALRAGQEVDVVVGARRFRGKLTHLGLEPLARDASGAALYALEASFPTGDEVLRAGARAAIGLP